MPTRRTAYVLITLILAFSSSATHAGTTPTPSPPVTTTASSTATATTPSTPTVTPTATQTSTACAGEPARLNPVTSPTDLLQQTITGSGRPLEDAGGSTSIYVITPAGVFFAFSSFLSPSSTYAVIVDLVPGVNDLTVCQTSVVCLVVPCTSYDLNGNPLQIIVIPPTPSPTPTNTPIPPLCVGDCNRDGEVTVDELITGVNMALGTISPRSCDAFCVPSCTGGPGFGPVTVDCIIRGVSNALDGCLTRCVTDQDCNPGNPCLSYECTASGCQYQCRCV